jgi:hypothetical protein
MLGNVWRFLSKTFRDKLWGTVAGAILGALFGFIWDDIDALVRYWVQPGNMGGAYVMKSSVIDDNPPYAQVPHFYKVTLKHGGTQVFGTLESQGGKRWNFYGYVRNKFVSLAYGGVQQDGLGTGTYSMQKDVDNIIWGHVTQVECIGLDAMYTRCPVIMHRVGLSAGEEKYKEFMSGACEKVVIKRHEVVQAPDRCADLKRKTAHVAH